MSTQCTVAIVGSLRTITMQKNVYGLELFFLERYLEESSINFSNNKKVTSYGRIKNYMT